jgi:hypothetical protein
MRVASILFQRVLRDMVKLWFFRSICLEENKYLG